MIKKILIVLSIFAIILSTITILKINNPNNKPNTLNHFKIINKLKSENNDIIGKLEIKSQNISENLYKVNSPENNVDKHVTILKESIMPDQENSIVFIAAHSGTGEIAYFKNLDTLKINESVYLTLYGKKYEYKVQKMWEQYKNGYISVNKDSDDQLILTTCSPKNDGYQLIVNCIKK